MSRENREQVSTSSENRCSITEASASMRSADTSGRASMAVTPLPGVRNAGTKALCLLVFTLITDGALCYRGDTGGTSRQVPNLGPDGEGARQQRDGSTFLGYPRGGRAPRHRHRCRGVRPPRLRSDRPRSERVVPPLRRDAARLVQVIGNGEQSRAFAHG